MISFKCLKYNHLLTNFVRSRDSYWNNPISSGFAVLASIRQKSFRRQDPHRNRRNVSSNNVSLRWELTTAALVRIVKTTILFALLTHVSRILRRLQRPDWNDSHRNWQDDKFDWLAFLRYVVTIIVGYGKRFAAFFFFWILTIFSSFCVSAVNPNVF